MCAYVWMAKKMYMCFFALNMDMFAVARLVCMCLCVSLGVLCAPVVVCD